MSDSKETGFEVGERLEYEWEEFCAVFGIPYRKPKPAQPVVLQCTSVDREGGVISFEVVR